MASKNEKYAYLFTVGVFAAQFVDIFFIHTDNSVFGDNIVARLVGILLAVLASIFLDFDLGKFCFKKFGWFFESLYGVVFAIVPIVFCYALEWLYLKIQGYSGLFISFNTPNYYYFGDTKYRLLAVLVYSIVLLVGVVFKELFFRGFLITQFSEKHGILKANIIQSVLYSVLSIPYILYSLVSGRFDNYSVLLTIYIILAYPINNFISGMKWGFFYRINGSIWMSISDHFVNNFVLTCVYISSDRLPEKWFIFIVFAVQIISCLMFVPFYIFRDKANVMLAEEIETGLEVLRAGGDLYTPEEEAHLLESEDVTEEVKPKDSAGQYFGSIVKDLDADVIDLRDIKQLEEPVPIVEVEEKPSEEKMIDSITSFELEIPDEIAVNEAESIGINPAEISKEYFGNMVEKSIVPERERKDGNEKSKVREGEDIKSDGESNASNISKLVDDFFNSQFDKHTF